MEQEKEDQNGALKEFKKKVSKNFKEKLNVMKEGEKSLQNEINELREKLEKEQEQLSDVNNILTAKNEQLEGLGVALSNAEKKFEEKEIELKTEIEELNNVLEEKEKSFEGQVTQLNEKLLKEQEELSEVKTQLSAKHDEFEKFVVVLTASEKKCEEKEVKLTYLNEAYSSAQSQIEDLENEIKQVKAELELKNDKIERLLADLKFLHGDNEEKVLAMSEKEKELTGEIKQLHTKLTREQEALADIFDNLSNKSSALEELKEQLEETTHNLLMKNVEADKSSKALKILENDKLAMQLQFDEIKLLSNDLRAENQEKELEVVSLNMCLSEKEEELKRLKVMLSREEVTESDIGITYATNDMMDPCVEEKVTCSPPEEEINSNNEFVSNLDEDSVSEDIQNIAEQIGHVNITVLQQENNILKEEIAKLEFNLKNVIDENVSRQNEQKQTLLDLEDENHTLKSSLKEFKIKASKKFKEKLKEAKEKENELAAQISALQSDMLKKIEEHDVLVQSYNELEIKFEHKDGTDSGKAKILDEQLLIDQERYESELRSVQEKLEEKDEEILEQQHQYNMEISQLNEALTAIKYELQQAEEKLSATDDEDQSKETYTPVQYHALLDKNANLTDTLQNKEELIIELTEKVNELEGELISVAENAVHELSLLSTDVDQLGDKLNESDVVLQKKDAELIEKDNYLQSHLDELERLKVELDHKTDLIGEMETELKLNNAELIEKEHMNEVNNLQTSTENVGMLSTELSLRKKLIAQMSDENALLQAELKEQKEHFDMTLTDYRERNSELKEALERMEQKVNLLNDRLKVNQIEFVKKESETISTSQSLENKLQEVLEKNSQLENVAIEKENCQHKIVVLKERLKVKEHELTKLQEEKREADDAVLSSESRYDDLLNEMKTKEEEWLQEKTLSAKMAQISDNEIKSLKLQVDDLATLQNHINEKDSQILSLRSAIEELELRNCLQQEDIVKLSNDVDASRSLYESQCQLCNELETELAEYKHSSDLSISSLNDSLINTNNERLKDKEEREKVSEDLKLRKTLIVSMQDENKQLKEALCKKDIEMKELEMSINDEKNKSLLELKEELDKTKSTLIRNEMKLADANMNVKVKFDSGKLKDHEFQNQIQAVEHELEDKNNIIAAYQKDVEQLQGDIKNITREWENLLHDKDVEIHDMKTELNNISEVIANKNEALKEFNENAIDRSHEIDNKRKELTADMDSKFIHIIDDTERLNAMQQYVTELIDQIAVQGVDIRGRKKMVAIANIQLKQATEEIHDLKEQLLNFSNESEMLKSELSSSNNDLDTLKVELSTLNLELAAKEMKKLEEINENIIPSIESDLEMSLNSSMLEAKRIDVSYMSEQHDTNKELPLNIQEQPVYAEVAFENFAMSVPADQDEIIVKDELQQYKKWIEEYQEKSSNTELENEETQLKFQREKTKLAQLIQKLTGEKRDLEEQIMGSNNKIKEYEHLVVKFAEETEETKSLYSDVSYQRDVLHNELYQLRENFSWREHDLTSRLTQVNNEFISLNEKLLTSNQEVVTLKNIKDAEINKLNENMQRKDIEFDNTVNTLKTEIQNLLLLNKNKSTEFESVTSKLQLTATELQRVTEELAQHRLMYNTNVDALQKCFEDMTKNSGLLEEQLAELQWQYQGKCVGLFISSILGSSSKLTILNN